MENTRELIVDMLLEIGEKERYSHLVIRDVLDKYNYMAPRDKAFIKRTVEGTLERMIQIDYVLDQFSKVPVSRMKPFIRGLLRMSVYQLLFMDSVPDRAVCNEAVKLAGKRGFRTLQGFVNGVLRTVGRQKAEIAYPNESENPIKYLSVKYSMPEWLVEKFIGEQGREKAEAICGAFLKETPVTLRLKDSLSEEERQRLLTDIKKSGGVITPHSYLPYAFYLAKAEGIEKVPGFSEGLFMVQDVSSMLVCEAAAISEGSYVIDVCAAPGGKALHGAEKLRGTGCVSARDLTEYKVSLIRDNIDRMKLSNVEALVWDACRLRQEDVERADILIADLPCSGLGVIGKKKDIKFHVSKESLQQVCRLQRQILDVVWRYVKPGGILIYSTCTINPMENQDNVHWFIQNYPFELQDVAPFMPPPLREQVKDGSLQLLPGIHETDGFFIARLKRKGI